MPPQDSGGGSEDSGNGLGDQEYSNPCEGHACGLGTNPPDAGTDAYPTGVIDGGIMPMPDASDKDAPIADAPDDAPFRCLGVCIEPDAETHPDSGFHGIIIGVVVRPDE